jgi:hypothetical protein
MVRMSASATLRPLLSTDWRLATEVAKEAEARGLTPDQIRGAREMLGVTKINGAVAFIAGHWHWRLPPDGCVTCHRPWGPGGHWRADYWADRPSAPVSAEEDDRIPPMDEPSAPTTPPTWSIRHEPAGPPRCSLCRKVSASDFGERCPWQTTAGQRCQGVMQ